MDSVLWQGLILVSKWLSYFALIGLSTKATVLALPSLANIPGIARVVHSILRFSLVLMLISSGVWFITNTGYLAESGWAGAFDIVMLEFMWQSPQGQTLHLRAYGIALVLLACVLMTSSSINRLRRFATNITYFAGLSCVVVSFSLASHTVEKSLLAQVLVVMHIGFVCFWLAVLAPLFYALKHSNKTHVLAALIEFGTRAVLPVVGVIFTGVSLIWILTSDLTSPLTHQYVWALLSKLIFVSLILMLAAINKFALVPAYLTKRGSSILKCSLKLESLTALLILLCTATLTTLVGPF